VVPDPDDREPELPAVDDRLVSPGAGYEILDGELVPVRDPGDLSPELPDVDARLISPGAGYEIHDGNLVKLPPVAPAEAVRRAKLAALVEAHAGAEHDVACDLLTRTSRTTDLTSDVSVVPRAPDPATDGRQIEQLAFLVVTHTTIDGAGRKAARLAARGVRRVLALDLEQVLEWSTELAAWSPLAGDAGIDDRALAVALPIAALLDAGKADDAVARALLAKRNPVLVAAEAAAGSRAEAVADGELRGKRDALLVVFAIHGQVPVPADRTQIGDERDPARLDRWIADAARGHAIAEVLAGS